MRYKTFLTQEEDSIVSTLVNCDDYSKEEYNYYADKAFNASGKKEDPLRFIGLANKKRVIIEGDSQIVPTMFTFLQ